MALSGRLGHVAPVTTRPTRSPGSLRTSRPDPAARSWGSEPRASGFVRLTSLFLPLLMTATACAAPGTGASSPPPSVAASAAPTLRASGETGGGEADRVDTAEEAFAAVVAVHPELAGHELRVSRPDASATHGPFIGGGGLVGGRSKWAYASADAAGIVISFVTGSGDCPSGCIDRTVEAYLVEPDATVVFLCRAEAAGPVTIGRHIGSDPCGEPAG